MSFILILFQFIEIHPLETSYIKTSGIVSTAIRQTAELLTLFIQPY